jgi:dihydrolipoamide dehydrogenase
MTSKAFDLIVIGSGPGGYVAALRAAQLGLKTACVEKDKALGGTCLNVGCIPSKTLLHATETYWNLLHGGIKEGIHFEKLSLDFSQLMQHKQKIVATFNQGIAALFKKNKVTHLLGEAHLLSERQLEVNGETFESKFFILATGSEPISLPFLPFDEERVLSSTGALALSRPPKSLLVVGAGVIGVEIGSVYARLGTETTFIEFLDRICPTLDESLSKALQEILVKQGMNFHLTSKVTEAKISSDEIVLKVGTKEFRAEKVLVCIGRKPFTQRLNLKAAGIETDGKGFIPIDGTFRTRAQNIFAIGDVVDGPMLAHKASEEGIAAAEIIAGHHPVIEYLAIPNVVYTSPEVASVGFSEEEAKKSGFALKIGMFPFKANSRAKCTNEEEGFVKIVADASSDHLLGIHIIGAHASELIAEGCLAMQKKLKVSDIIATPHAHPTLSEAIKEAALDVHRRALHR